MAANTNIRFEDWEAEQVKDPKFRVAVEELEPAYQAARLQIRKRLWAMGQEGRSRALEYDGDPVEGLRHILPEDLSAEEWQSIILGKPFSTIKLWQHEETGRITASESQPSKRWLEIPAMYEDELPEDISEETYSWWFDNSFVDGVRIGPKI